MTKCPSKPPQPWPHTYRGLLTKSWVPGIPYRGDFTGHCPRASITVCGTPVTWHCSVSTGPEDQCPLDPVLWHPQCIRARLQLDPGATGPGGLRHRRGPPVVSKHTAQASWPGCIPLRLGEKSRDITWASGLRASEGSMIPTCAWTCCPQSDLIASSAMNVKQASRSAAGSQIEFVFGTGDAAPVRGRDAGFYSFYF